MDDTRPFLNAAQVAARLNMNVHQVYRRISSGELKATRVKVRNLQWRVSEDDLQSYIDAGYQSDMLAVPDVAIMLGFSSETVRRMCTEGKLPAVRGGGNSGHYRIPRKAVEDYLSASR